MCTAVGNEMAVIRTEKSTLKQRITAKGVFSAIQRIQGGKHEGEQDER
jgi:hypothetical protein